MESLIDTSNNFNDQYICESDEKRALIDGTNVYSTKVKPTLYNLPDDNYTREDLYAFEEDRYSYVLLSVKRFLRSLPLKWLSQITSKYNENYEDILIIENNNLPDSIKQYVKSYYVKFHDYSDKTKNKFASVIHSNIEKDSREGSLSDYLKALDKQNQNSFCVGSCATYYCDDIWYHIFDGITLSDFYKIYFKSGLSKEVILRYLSDTEFIYSVDNQVVKEEVERILSKH
jgi:hypothetical protein